MTREWEAAHAAVDVALASDRLFLAGAEVRLAKLKHAAELERQGRVDDAAVILAEVRAEQERVTQGGAV